VVPARSFGPAVRLVGAVFRRCRGVVTRGLSVRHVAVRLCWLAFVQLRGWPALSRQAGFKTGTKFALLTTRFYLTQNAPKFTLYLLS
jgi:hypothetical protein